MCEGVSQYRKAPEPSIERFLAQACSALEIMKIWMIDFVRISVCFSVLWNVRMETTVDHDHFVVLDNKILETTLEHDVTIWHTSRVGPSNEQAFCLPHRQRNQIFCRTGSEFVRASFYVDVVQGMLPFPNLEVTAIGGNCVNFVNSKCTWGWILTAFKLVICSIHFQRGFPQALSMEMAIAEASMDAFLGFAHKKCIASMACWNPFSLFSFVFRDEYSYKSTHTSAMTMDDDP